MWWLLILIVVVYIIYRYIYGKDNYWPKQGVEYLNINQIASAYKRFSFQVPLAEIDMKTYSHFKNHPYGGYMEFRTPTLFIKDLDLIKQILVKDFDHFVDRRNLHLTQGEPQLSRMLTELTGKEWKDTRALITPTFTTGKIRRMYQFFNASGRHLTSYLTRRMQEDSSDQIDFMDTFGRYSLDVIAAVAFGLQSDTFSADKGQGSDESVFRDMAKKFNGLSPLILIKFLTYVFFPSIGSALKLTVSEPTSMNFFTTIIRRAIQQRKQDGTGEMRNDFLQILMEAQAGQLDKDDDDKGQTVGTGKNDMSHMLDDNTLIGQCLLFFSAGSDTIESALTFAAYSLAVHQDIQDKLREELEKVIKVDGDLTYEMINNLEYLEMVICETLRLYPPAVAAERTCTTEYVLPNTNVRLPKGTLVHIPIHGIHHDEKYYPNPEQFNPENFNSENKSKRHSFTFMPFSMGPRSCIAMRFAMTEAKAGIAHLIHNFKIEPCEKTQIPVKFDANSFVLKPEKGMFLKFTPLRHK